MSWYSPRYQVGDAIFFRYVPFDKVDLDTGEAILQTAEIPCTVLGIAHSFDHHIESSPGVTLPRAFFNAQHTCNCDNFDGPGFFYFVRIDQEEAAALGLTLTYPDKAQLTTEVVREYQITRERIEF